MLGIKIGITGIVISGFTTLCLAGLAMENVISISVVSTIGIIGICLFSVIFIIGLICEQ